MTLFELIVSDLRAKSQWQYKNQTWKSILTVLLADGTPTMLMYRVMQSSHKAGLSPVAMMFNKLITWFGQCVIGRGADFGPAFVILYSNGIMINGKVKGGSNVFLVHQIMLGESLRGAPVLGDHVFISSGARVLGPVKVGNHVTIGPNTVVLSNVPDGASVLGVPGQIIFKAALPTDEGSS